MLTEEGHSDTETRRNENKNQVYRKLARGVKLVLRGCLHAIAKSCKFSFCDLPTLDCLDAKSHGPSSHQPSTHPPRMART